MTTDKINQFTVTGGSPEAAAEWHERVKISVITYAICSKDWGPYGPQLKDCLVLIGHEEPAEKGCWAVVNVRDGFFDSVPGISATGEGLYIETACKDARDKLLAVLLAADLSAMTPSQREGCEQAIAEIRGEDP